MRRQIVAIARPHEGTVADPAAIGLLRHEGTRLSLRDGRRVRVRAVGPADGAPIQDFVRNLSVTSRRLRFFATVNELPPGMLARLTAPAAPGRVVVAEAQENGIARIVALAQHAPGTGDGTCELAFAVADAFQGVGLGRGLMAMQLRLARAARYLQAIADVQYQNQAMIALGLAHGFIIAASPHDASLIRLERDLQQPRQ